MQSDDPPFLPVGTEVSAKFKGAFCEAKIKKILRSLKCKVLVKDPPLGVVLVEQVWMKEDVVLELGGIVEFTNDKGTFRGTLHYVKDYSTYHVVFNDGDEKSLKRSQICRKSPKHFAVNLDALPLYNPEQFGTPVLKGRDAKDKKRKVAANAQQGKRRKQDEDKEDTDNNEDVNGVDEDDDATDGESNLSSSKDANKSLPKLTPSSQRTTRSSMTPSTPTPEDKKRGRRLTDNSASPTSDSPRKKMTRRMSSPLPQVFIPGSVYSIYDSQKKDGKWFPGVVISSTSSNLAKAKVTEKEVPVRSFQNGRYYAVDRTFVKRFVVEEQTNPPMYLKVGVERAVAFVESGALPSSWEKQEIFAELIGREFKKPDPENVQVPQVSQVPQLPQVPQVLQVPQVSQVPQVPQGLPFDNTISKKADVPVSSSEEEDDDDDDTENEEKKDFFVAQLYKFQEERGTPMNIAPVIGERDLDLYKFHEVVTDLGGFKRVTSNNHWDKILKRMKLRDEPGASALILKNAYEKYLLPFDTFHKRLGWSVGNYSSSTSRTRERRPVQQISDASTPNTSDKRAKKKENLKSAGKGSRKAKQQKVSPKKKKGRPIRVIAKPKWKRKKTKKKNIVNIMYNIPGYHSCVPLTAMYIGQQVLVQYEGDWYDAVATDVRQATPDRIIRNYYKKHPRGPVRRLLSELSKAIKKAKVLVHYTDWDTSFDEWIYLNDLQIKATDLYTAFLILKRACLQLGVSSRVVAKILKIYKIARFIDYIENDDMDNEYTLNEDMPIKLTWVPDRDKKYRRNFARSGAYKKYPYTRRKVCKLNRWKKKFLAAQKEKFRTFKFMKQKQTSCRVKKPPRGRNRKSKLIKKTTPGNVFIEEGPLRSRSDYRGGYYTDPSLTPKERELQRKTATIARASIMLVDPRKPTKTMIVKTPKAAARRKNQSYERAKPKVVTPKAVTPKAVTPKAVVTKAALPPLPKPNPPEVSAGPAVVKDVFEFEDEITVNTVFSNRSSGQTNSKSLNLGANSSFSPFVRVSRGDKSFTSPTSTVESPTREVPSTAGRQTPVAPVIVVPEPTKTPVLPTVVAKPQNVPNGVGVAVPSVSSPHVDATAESVSVPTTSKTISNDVPVVVPEQSIPTEKIEEEREIIPIDKSKVLKKLKISNIRMASSCSIRKRVGTRLLRAQRIKRELLCQKLRRVRWAATVAKQTVTKKRNSMKRKVAKTNKKRNPIVSKTAKKKELKKIRFQTLLIKPHLRIRKRKPRKERKIAVVVPQQAVERPPELIKPIPSLHIHDSSLYYSKDNESQIRKPTSIPTSSPLLGSPFGCSSAGFQPVSSPDLPFSIDLSQFTNASAALSAALSLTQAHSRSGFNHAPNTGVGFHPVTNSGSVLSSVTTPTNSMRSQPSPHSSHQQVPRQILPPPRTRAPPRSQQQKAQAQQKSPVKPLPRTNQPKASPRSRNQSKAQMGLNTQSLNQAQLNGIPQLQSQSLLQHQPQSYSQLQPQSYPQMHSQQTVQRQTHLHSQPLAQPIPQQPMKCQVQSKPDMQCLPMSQLQPHLQQHIPAHLQQQLQQHLQQQQQKQQQLQQQQQQQQQQQHLQQQQQHLQQQQQQLQQHLQLQPHLQALRQSQGQSQLDAQIEPQMSAFEQPPMTSTVNSPRPMITTKAAVKVVSTPAILARSRTKANSNMGTQASTSHSIPNVSTSPAYLTAAALSKSMAMSMPMEVPQLGLPVLPPFFPTPEQAIPSVTVPVTTLASMVSAEMTSSSVSRSSPSIDRSGQNLPAVENRAAHKSQEYVATHTASSASATVVVETPRRSSPSTLKRKGSSQESSAASTPKHGKDKKAPAEIDERKTCFFSLSAAKQKLLISDKMRADNTSENFGALGIPVDMEQLTEIPDFSDEKIEELLSRLETLKDMYDCEKKSLLASEREYKERVESLIRIAASCKFPV